MAGAFLRLVLDVLGVGVGGEEDGRGVSMKRGSGWRIMLARCPRFWDVLGIDSCFRLAISHACVICWKQVC